MTKMSHLNRDILQEIFYECVQSDGFNKIDEFMLAGREPFQLVLDYCKNANSVVIFGNEIVAKFPNINDDVIKNKRYDCVIGTSIPTSMKLFKPISVAIASTLTSLEIKRFSRELIPMLKSIKHEITEIIIDKNNFLLIDILEACENISCQKLTLKNIYFEDDLEKMNGSNPQLRNIRNLTIFGRFHKIDTMQDKLNTFAAFLLTTFPNLETLNVKFVNKTLNRISWNWNDSSMANIFQQLPRQIQGCISFKLYTGSYTPQNDDFYAVEITPCLNSMEYREYYKSFPITGALNFQLMHQGCDIHQFFSISDIYEQCF